MEYVRLGTTGLEVSRICLGGMSFGVPSRGPHPWTLDEDASRSILRHAIDLGINFFDTANSYSAGTSEEFLGRALSQFGSREDFVIATKVFDRMRPGPNGGGLSRVAIVREVDNSLRRLGTDYIDLYQIHHWDYHTPISETLDALDDIVKAGKVRYIGACAMYAWQFSKSLYTSTLHSWAKFVTMQDHYNLLNREHEREMQALCADWGVGVLPWSPLARGRLARRWNEASARTHTDEFGKTLYEEKDRVIVERVTQVASERGLRQSQVALAWLLSRPGVTAPIVGATRVEHVTEAAEALTIDLSKSDVKRLEEVYEAHELAGFV